MKTRFAKKMIRCLMALAVIAGTQFVHKNIVAQADDAYFAAIQTGIAGGTLQDGVLIVRDGKIVAVGERGEIEVPVNARLHELTGKTIIPGLVIAETNLTGGRDVERTLSPEVNAIDGFDFFEERSKLLASGITTIQISPGGNRLMPGVCAVVKLAGEGDDLESLENRVLNHQESLRIVLDNSSRNPPTIYEPPVGPVSVDRPLLPTRPQVSKTLMGSLAGLRLIFRNATASQRYVSNEADAVTNTIAAYLDTSRVVRMTASTDAEVRGAISLAREFDLELLLVDCDAKALQNVLKDDSIKLRGVVLKALKPGTITNPSADAVDDFVAPWETLNELDIAKHAIAIRANSDSDLVDLMFSAGQFVQGNLTADVITTCLTHAPAKMLGVSDRVGSLSKGLDADFVVISGQPFTLRSKIVATYVDGEKVYDRHSPEVTTVIRAGRVYTGDGEILDNASVTVKGNSIRGLGKDVSAPLDSIERDFGDAVIVPGFVDLSCGLGVGDALSGNVGLNTRLGDQLYADDPAIRIARASGVTTVLLGSMATTQPTPLVAFKLGDNARVIKDPAAIRFVMGDNPATSVTSIEAQLKRGKAYADSWIKYEADLKEYEVKKAEADKAAAEKAAAEKKAKEEAEKKAAEEKAAAEKTSGEKKTDDAVETGGRGSGGRPGERGTGERGTGRPVRGETPSETEKPKEGEPDKDKEEKEGEKKDAEKPKEQDITETKEDDKKGEGSTDDKDKAEQAEEKKDEAPKLEAPKKPDEQKELEPYRILFAGEIPALVEARRADAIEAALALFRDKYDIRTVIAGADDVSRFPEIFKDKKVTVCAGPELVIDLKTPQQPDQRVNVAQVLANEGIAFGLQSKATTGVAQLPNVVQFAISQGLGVEDGLAALTKSPASILSEGMSFGTLAEGKDADLVVLSGPPFELSTKVLAVMIDGRWVYEHEEKE